LERCFALVKELSTASLSETNAIFNELNELIGFRLQKYVAYRFGNQGQYFVDEVLQRTWITVWEKASQCRKESPASTIGWIYRISRNLAYNLLRDSKHIQEIVNLEEDEGDEVAFPERTINRRKLNSGPVFSNRPTEERVIEDESKRIFLASLTKNQYPVFILWIYGYKEKEIADILEISPQRVSQYMKQISAKRLSDKYKGLGFE